MKFTINPYCEKDKAGLLKLENESVQGGILKMRMIKPELYSRAKVFPNHILLVAHDAQHHVAGLLAAAKTKMVINQQKYEPFCMFDARVGIKYRGNRLAHLMIQSLLHEHNPFGTKNYFVTLKSNNYEVKSNIRKDYNFMSLVGFVYLTVPTSIRLKNIKRGKEPDFEIIYFEDEFHLKHQFHNDFDSISVWQTWKMYTLEITEMPWPASLAIKIINAVRPTKRLPQKNEEIRFASAHSISELQLRDVQEAMKVLHNDGIGYLNICCRKGDYLYNTFASHAISKYDYVLASKYTCTDKEKVKIDVRCL